MEHRAQVGIECPTCHLRQFVEVQLENPLSDSPMAEFIRAQLAAWLASRCPDHLVPILEQSKN